MIGKSKIVKKKGMQRRSFLKLAGLSSIGLGLGFPLQTQWAFPSELETRGGNRMKILDFVEAMKEKATKGLQEVSGGGKCVEKTHTFKVGQAEIITIRGGAIEKASITHLTLKGFKVSKDEQMNAMVYQMEVFPENPYCPIGHFNTEWTMGNQASYHMNLDLFPAVRVEEDLNTMRRLMDGVADKFGRDRNKMRAGLDTHYNMDHWAFPLATKVGCKLLKLKESDLDLYITAYHTFFDTYLDILKKRRDTPYSEEERRLKLEINGKWLEYLTLKDGAIKMAQSNGIPPEVIISQGFPPSAVF
jgi:coproporphyrinogen III oxidase